MGFAIVVLQVLPEGDKGKPPMALIPGRYPFTYLCLTQNIFSESFLTIQSNKQHIYTQTRYC